MMSVKVRKELTDEWQARGITQDKEYAILTDEMTKAWSELSVREYKEHKGLKKESLRDNMTNIELILNMLAEATTTALSQKEQPTGMSENVDVARRGGSFAGQTRKGYEKLLGQPVVSSINAKDKPALEITASEIEQIADVSNRDTNNDTNDDTDE